MNYFQGLLSKSTCAATQRLLITGGHDKMLKAWALAGMRDASLPAPAPAAGAVGAGGGAGAAGAGMEETPVQSFVGHAKVGRCGLTLSNPR
jgi:hypothetical protein